MAYVKEQFVNAAAYARFLDNITLTDGDTVCTIIRHDMINCLNAITGMCRMFVQYEFKTVQVDPAWRHAAQTVIDLTVPFPTLLDENCEQLYGVLPSLTPCLSAVQQHMNILMAGFADIEVDPVWHEMVSAVNNATQRAQIIMAGVALTLIRQQADP